MSNVQNGNIINESKDTLGGNYWNEYTMVEMSKYYNAALKKPENENEKGYNIPSYEIQNNLSWTITKSKILYKNN